MERSSVPHVIVWMALSGFLYSALRPMAMGPPLLVRGAGASCPKTSSHMPSVASCPCRRRTSSALLAMPVWLRPFCSGQTQRRRGTGARDQQRLKKRTGGCF